MIKYYVYLKLKEMNKENRTDEENICFEVSRDRYNEVKHLLEG